MKKAILVVGLCVSGFTFAQNYVNQVLVLNEGYFYLRWIISEPTYITITYSMRVPGISWSVWEPFIVG